MLKPHTKSEMKMRRKLQFSAKGFRFLSEGLDGKSVQIYFKMDLMLMGIYRIIPPANLTIRKNCSCAFSFFCAQVHP